jgi:hypothetical protein
LILAAYASLISTCSASSRFGKGCRAIRSRAEIFIHTVRDKLIVQWIKANRMIHRAFGGVFSRGSQSSGDAQRMAQKSA